MGGGQWQVIYLLERIEGATLLARRGSPLLDAAIARRIEARAFSIAEMFRSAQDVDLIHAHDARAHSMAAAVAGTKLVVSRRVAFPVGTGLISRVKYGRADLFLAVSRRAAVELEAVGVRKEKIRVVYDGVALADSARGDAIVALASKREDLVRRAAELAGVDVRFTRNLWDDLAKAKMFLYASDSEGLGSAALAAMSASVPVIASNVGGLAEVVENGRTGILVENRAEEFSQAIGRLLGDPGLAQEMGRRGRERVEKMFTIEHMVRGTIAAYEEVLRG